MKKIVFLSLTAMVICGCSHDFSNYHAPIDVSSLQDKDPNAVTEEDIQANVASIFGTIDPNQDWNLTNTGSITITADANLDEIVKVQILTESPFFNPNVRVLSEVAAKKGETVALSYEAPSEYTNLVAACVDSKGVYYIKSFAVGSEAVNFTSSSAARSKTRAGEGYPDASKIVLELKNTTLSFNAIRTQLANQAAAGDQEMKQWVDNNGIGIWTNKGWENERLWKATSNNNIGNSWKIENGCIYRTIDDIDSEEKAQLETIFTNLLGRGKTGKRDKIGELKRDNLDLIRNSSGASLYNNHIISSGSEITITPVQLASIEAKNCQIYYYYYNPQDIPATVSEEEYVKELPKFEAINCNIANNGTETFFKSREYLLPYYGDNLSEMMEARVMENYKTDGKVYRFRNGQKWNSNDYYLSYFISNTGDDGRARLSLFAEKGETDYKNQLWQIFTDEGTGLSYLFNIGLQRFLLHQEATAKDYLTSFSASDVLAGDEIPLVIDMQNDYICIRRTNSTTLGLGTDLDNNGKASRLCVSSDKDVTKSIGKWYMEECTDKSDLDLKTEIKRAATSSVTAVSNVIPAGYKVGFMIRKTKSGEDVNNLNHVKGTNNGCCYGFGSMNKTLNQFGDFAYAVSRYSMKIDDPRVLMFSANNKTYLAFEEGVDCQYSDVIIEITQGTNKPLEDPITSIEQNVYTVCIEDRPISDYDMNDVILTAERVGDTHTQIQVTVYACGAYDELYIKGLHGQKINEETEIHRILGAEPGTYVNTNGSIDHEPVSEVFEVGANTSIIEFLKGISIYDKTIDHTITFSEKGDDPHAIVVPCDFAYPAEHVRITEAYPLFKNWATNAKTDNGWYNSPKTE